MRLVGVIVDVVAVRFLLLNFLNFLLKILKVFLSLHYDQVWVDILPREKGALLVFDKCEIIVFALIIPLDCFLAHLAAVDANLELIY